MSPWFETFSLSFSPAYFNPTDSTKLLTTDQMNQIRIYCSYDWSKPDQIIKHPHRQFQHLTPIKVSVHKLQILKIGENLFWNCGLTCWIFIIIFRQPGIPCMTSSWLAGTQMIVSLSMTREQLTFMMPAVVVWCISSETPITPASYL